MVLVMLSLWGGGGSGSEVSIRMRQGPCTPLFETPTSVSCPTQDDPPEAKATKPAKTRRPKKAAAAVEDADDDAKAAAKTAAAKAAVRAAVADAKAAKAAPKKDKKEKKTD